MSIKNPATKEWLFELLNSLRMNKFYGTILLELHNGEVVLVRKHENIKPPEANKQG